MYFSSLPIQSTKQHRRLLLNAFGSHYLKWMIFAFIQQNKSAYQYGKHMRAIYLWWIGLPTIVGESEY